jgi:hypothetical protein
MKLVWGRGHNSEILLLSNSLTLAWEPIATNSNLYDVSSLTRTQRFYDVDFPRQRYILFEGWQFCTCIRTLVKRISDNILDHFLLVA